MKKKILVIGGIAAATLLVGGWALAQSGDHGPGGMRGSWEWAWAAARWGKACRGQMGPGMHGANGPRR